MYEINLISNLNSIFDALSSSTESIIIAQTNGEDTRINVGHQILVFDHSVLNFKKGYCLMSLSQVRKNKKLLEELSVHSALNLVSVIPKEWGYKFKIYKGVKCLKSINLVLYVTRSPLVCWTYLIKKFFSFKKRK